LRALREGIMQQALRTEKERNSVKSGFFECGSKR
jgi:hypothetical protein